VSRDSLRKGAHVVFDIHLHMGFITKFRRLVFTEAMLADMKPIFVRVLTANQCILEEFNG
jgi:putative transposase